MQSVITQIHCLRGACVTKGPCHYRSQKGNKRLTFSIVLGCGACISKHQGFVSCEGSLHFSKQLQTTWPLCHWQLHNAISQWHMLSRPGAIDGRATLYNLSISGTRLA